jgi:hypothetical protein
MSSCAERINVVKFKTGGQPIWQAHFYRQAYGDAGITPLPYTVLPDETQLTNILVEQSAVPRHGYKPPITVDITDEEGGVVMRARMIAPDTAQIVNLRARS